MQAEIYAAVQQLAYSERGRDTLRTLERWLYREGGICLDGSNQGAVRTLLAAAWGQHAGTVRNVLQIGSAVDEMLQQADDDDAPPAGVLAQGVEIGVEPVVTFRAPDTPPWESHGEGDDDLARQYARERIDWLTPAERNNVESVRAMIRLWGRNGRPGFRAAQVLLRTVDRLAPRPPGDPQR